MNELITIPFSHYCEKARWGLERYGVRYLERRYMPGLHFVPVKRAIRNGSDACADGESSRLSTPVFCPHGGRPICDSTRILQWIARQEPEAKELFPDSHVAAFERRISSALGPHTRRVAYAWIGNDIGIMQELARQNVGWMQQRVFAFSWPKIKPKLMQILSIEPAAVQESQQVIRTIVDEVSAELAGKRFLHGERFSAADLSFACMLAPVLGLAAGEGYGAVLPPRERMPAAAVEFCTAIRATRAGAHALAMFAGERSRRGRPGG